MRQTQLLFAVSLGLLVACTGNVNLGGPRDDAGQPAQDSAAPSGDSGTDSASPATDAGADDAAPGPSAALDEAQSYANGNVACVADSDCCVVFDQCVNRGLIVGLADKDKVATLLSEYDHYEETVGTSSVCTGCIPPAIQVTCVNAKCIGTTIPFTLPDGGHVDQSFWTNHCGSTPNAPVSSQTGSILGC